MRSITSACAIVAIVTSNAYAAPPSSGPASVAPFGCTEPQPAPGSTCALLRYKQPYLFPTDGSVDKSRPAPRSDLPSPGTTEAYLFYKHPAVYGPRSQATGATETLGYYPAPGTPEWFRCYKLGDCRKPESAKR